MGVRCFADKVGKCFANGAAGRRDARVASAVWYSIGCTESGYHDAGSEREQGQTDSCADAGSDGWASFFQRARIAMHGPRFAIWPQQRFDFLSGIQGLLAISR